jgi:anti-sigma factor RsiW
VEGTTVTEPTCEWIRDLIADYIYGGLTEAEVEAVERHLADCPACLAEVEGTRRALATVDRAGLGSAPDGLAEDVIAGVAAELVRPRPWLRVAVSLAACLALAVVGTWAFVLAPGSGSRGPDPALMAETAAVAANAEGVLRLVDELEQENDALLRLLSQGGAPGPAAGGGQHKGASPS